MTALDILEWSVNTLIYLSAFGHRIGVNVSKLSSSGLDSETSHASRPLPHTECTTTMRSSRATVVSAESRSLNREGCLCSLTCQHWSCPPLRTHEAGDVWTASLWVSYLELAQMHVLKTALWQPKASSAGRRTPSSGSPLWLEISSLGLCGSWGKRCSSKYCWSLWWASNKGCQISTCKPASVNLSNFSGNCCNLTACFKYCIYWLLKGQLDLYVNYSSPQCGMLSDRERSFWVILILLLRELCIKHAFNKVASILGVGL